MSGEVLILYGSRARGDAGPNADVDLMLATGAPRPQSPVECMGVSLHRYPRTWLLERAGSGDLFAYHVGHEGVALQDADAFLLELRAAFMRRPSYVADARNGLLVARLLAEDDWGLDAGLRRRFFWGVRTCIISRHAEHARPVFAARELERLSGIDGLADALARREIMTFQECRALGKSLEAAVGDLAPASITGEVLRSALAAAGGFPAECALALERRRWEDGADGATYA
ncbi:nucleotidyltransferase domain-containing protein [Sphingomonas carotinifaciens]|uniref:Nucleotidyltransferase domain-containing protein n=1 Tax=Sphingomonas carotinifaciens TaxID=1166323 RepID=A0A1G7NF06_9SPHN|nr:nucleotidyltransferase domain-containing protein [Sphingomonas carotinifaciens]MBB4087105.1 hypothetical protein [Sphingomonas carotinifaciens]MWC43208.1 hypothetical protein [Sphingomonas carotinifaciens]SDF72552.1 Nucleotidyltransferase domain-containing protein [Sphingomonas carotinifaciens]